MRHVTAPAADASRPESHSYGLVAPGCDEILEPFEWFLRLVSRRVVAAVEREVQVDPDILLEAMRRFDFDTVLVALNAADVHRLSFIRTVLPEAARRGMGVIGMKVCAQGALLRAGGVRGVFNRGGLTMDEALGYVLSLDGVSTAIVGCRTATEVEENARIVREFAPLEPDAMRALEQRTVGMAAAGGYYKRQR